MKTKKVIWFCPLIIMGTLLLLTHGCKKEEPLIAKVPVLTTSVVKDVAETLASCGGNITNDGGAKITAKGVCWSTTTAPTISNSKTVDGTGTGSFISNMTGLTTFTTYYVRAYATNSAGTAYGNEINFTTTGIVTDVEGNVYNTVSIGTQLWMKENLKTTKYLNSDLIGTTTPATLDITNEITPKYQWAYDGDENNVAIYGRLYTWFTVTDSRNVCPTGWSVPTDAQWTTLTDYLTNNGYGYGGNATWIAKSMSATSGWPSSDVAGTVGNDQASNNSSGFTALQNGSRVTDGTFAVIGEMAIWWSASSKDETDAWAREIYFRNLDIPHGFQSKKYGWAVRCLKD
jgi:uncharacterized protein (TIGR02145 family)